MMKNFTTRLPFRLDRNDVLGFLFWAIIVFLTWLFMDGADHFLLLTPEALGKYFDVRWVLIAHITAGGGALVLGLIQFWRKLRLYSSKIHRVIGGLYLLAILVSSFCAIVLASTTAYEVNWAYAFSLQVWAVVWISSSAIAYYAALKKKFTMHKQWMIRSYMVTLAFIVSGLLLKTTFIQSFGTFAEVSPSLFWFGWSVPLYMYEIAQTVRGRS